jgi:hypothetical protein
MICSVIRVICPVSRVAESETESIVVIKKMSVGMPVAVINKSVIESMIFNDMDFLSLFIMRPSVFFKRIDLINPITAEHTGIFNGMSI